MPLVIGDDVGEEPAASEAHERARKIRPEYTRGDLVRVAGARHQAEAELIQNLLLEEGIPSVFRRSIGFDVPDFLAAGWRDVLVPQSGAEAAYEVLTAADIEPAGPPQRRAHPALDGRGAAHRGGADMAGSRVAPLSALSVRLTVSGSYITWRQVKRTTRQPWVDSC